MAEHAASAAGLRAQAAVRRPPPAEVIVLHLRVGMPHRRKGIGVATDGRPATASPTTMNGRRYAASN
jgi:hypothetical protein